MTTYPLALPVRPSGESWIIENADLSGGLSIGGQEQVVATGTGRWRAKLSWQSVFEDDKVALRGFVLGLRGRAGTARIGPADYASGLPWGRDQYGRLKDLAAVARPQLKNTAYADPPGLAASLLSRTVLFGPLMGARAVSVNRTAGADARPGNYIGLGGCLHIVTQVEVLDVGSSTYSIEPPLRLDLAAGAPVTMIAPTCQMRLASNVSDISINSDLAADISLDFVEVF